MNVSAVNGGNETNYTAAANQALRETNSELGKEAFLKILIAQLSNQDPLDPLKDKDFIAQMAQFSTLEQMTNMNKSIEQMNAVTKGSAVNYIGRVVEYLDDEGLSTYGTVAYVRFDKSGVILTTTEEIEIPLEKVVAVG
ncbi:flagellar basal-body rod modification protein FlgD [Aminivibrio pyruvatiphilus]|jgi:flagellar basal-body rod modification protein FlgD|uniref:Flagellar basal-body rod modification protein FlgD n=1 Tax=Aminivibrio pyruvatiphilus TaxID=1005740 RepID=A0A4R8MHI9_9BACT|nr:flagellar hook capping FlgD N-terminal domain-containing protein [Aminivibrio pyruvatiphilus]TDY65054.1 flagellar basal-body rod modification protein FlgD [Aminivibrio pyruvatiphilus]